MINYDHNLVSALSTILPTYYEMALTSKATIPCISYMGRDNRVEVNGNTIGYSRISYTVKVWGRNIKDIQRYSLEIDRVMRTLGFTRISSGELYDNQSTMIQKIMAYEALALESY
jgi:hypothetical protein